MREYRFWVYIMASKSRRIYTGMTNDLCARVLQHKSGEIEGFTKKYKINRLVYYEEYKYVYNTIRREKQIKGLDRAKWIALIESMNPTWEDLASDWGKPIELLKPRVHDLGADASLRSS
jgi:putative endonuclease